jgi:hypothetical protein
MTTHDERDHDEQDDRSLAAVASLRTYDVAQRRSRHLRTRCHAVLAAQARPVPSARSAEMIAAFFRRVVGPVVGGAWCLAYLVEMIRRAAAISGLPH